MKLITMIQFQIIDLILGKIIYINIIKQIYKMIRTMEIKY